MSINSPTHDEIEQIAYRLWQERGAPIGSPEVDWDRAQQEVSERHGNGGNGGDPREIAAPGAAPSGATAKGRRGQRAEHNS